MAAEYAGILSSWRRLSSCVSSRATRAEIDDPFWCSATLARTNKVCPRTAVVKVSASRLDVLCFITFTSSLSSNAFTHLHVAEIQRQRACLRTSASGSFKALRRGSTARASPLVRAPMPPENAPQHADLLVPAQNGRGNELQYSHDAPRW